MHPLYQLQLHLQVCSSDFSLRLITFSFFFCSLCCNSFGLDTGATNAPTEPVTIAPTGMFLKRLVETFHFFFLLVLTLLLFFWFSHWSYQCTLCSSSYNCTYRYVLQIFYWDLSLFFFFCSLCCFSFGLATGATNAPTEPATNAPTGKFLKTLFETFHFFFLRGLTLLLFFWFSHWSYQCTHCASYKCTYRYVLQKVGWHYSLFFFYCSLCYYSSGLATATNAPTLSITIAPTGMFFGRLVEFILFFSFFCSLICYSSGFTTATNAPTVAAATIAPTGMFFGRLVDLIHFFFFLLLTLLLFFWFSHCYKCTYWASYSCAYRYVLQKVGWDLPLFLSSSAHFAAILLT